MKFQGGGGFFLNFHEIVAVSVIIIFREERPNHFWKGEVANASLKKPKKSCHLYSAHGLMKQ